MAEIRDPKPTGNRAVAIQTNQRVRLESDQPTWNWFVRTNGGSWSQFATGTGVAVWSAPATVTEKLTFDRVEIAIGSAGSPDTSTTRHFDLCEGPVAGFWLTDQLRDESLESPPLQPDLWEVDDPPLGLPTLMPGASRQGFGTSHLNRVDMAGGPANLIALFGPGVSVDSAGRLGARTPGAMVRGLGPWPAFVNQYHAGLYFNYDFGKSRTIGVTRVLYQDGSSHVSIVRGDGRKNTYRYNGSTWDAAASLGNSLALVGGKFQETTPTGRVYHYNAVSSGRASLDRVIDRYGSPIYYDYDVNARLQKVRGPTGSAGLVPYFSYNASGLLSSVVLQDATTPANNRVTYYEYDGNRNATKIIGPELCITYFEYNTPELLSAVTDPEGYRWYFAYSGGRAERVLDALSPARASYFSYDSGSAVATYRARDAKVTYFQPNAWGEPLRVYNPGTIADYYSYDGDGNLATAKNRLGKQWSYSYDSRGNRIAITDPYSARNYFAYDGQDLLKFAIDPLSRFWYFDYDANRNLTRQVDPFDKTTYFGYQTVGSMPNAGLLQYRKDRRGNFTYFRFDARANNDAVVDALAQKTYFEFNSAGERTKVFDARSNAAYFDYDKRGRLTQSKDAYLNTKKWAYDSRCNVTTEVDENAHSTYHTYDGNSNRIKTVRDMGGGDYLSTYFRYDEDERLAGRKDARLNETYWTYDGLGRRQKQVNALGDETYWSYDAAHQLEREQQPAQSAGAGRATSYYSYDDAARMRQTIDPGQLLTYHSFDQKGNVLFTNRDQGWGRQPWGSSPWGGERATTYMQYDALDRQIRLTDAYGAHSYWEYDVESNLERTLNPRGLTMYYTYDALNRRTHEKDNVVLVASYIGYDPVGNVVRRIDQKLAETYFTFDKLNRQESMAGPFMPGSSVDAHTYHAYDAASNRVEVRVENPRGSDRRSTYYEYDFANRTTRMIEPEAASGATRGTMLYEYDRVGNQTKVVDQEGRGTYFRFDALNREDARWNAQVETSYLHYDGRGAVIRQVDPEGRTAYFEQDLQGRVRSQSNALGEVSYFFYDARGQRTHVANPRGFSTYFQYDLLGRQSRRTHALGGVAYMGYDSVGNQVLSLDELQNPTYFEFDRLNRLSKVKDAAFNVTYFGYDERSSQVLRLDADGRATYMGYDAARRLERRFFKNPVAGEATDSPSYFVYDTINLKLVDDRLASLGVSYFDHDKLDRLTKKTTIAGAVYYAYDLSGMKTSVKDPRLVETVNVYDSVGRVTKSQVSAGRSAYFTYDKSGMPLRKIGPGSPSEIVAYHTYDVAGRLKELENRSSPSGALVTYFAYQRNPNGSITRMAHEGGEFTYYTYDGLERLTEERRTQNPTVYGFQYTYDAASRRLTKTDLVGTDDPTYSYNSRNLVTGENIPDVDIVSYVYDNSQRMQKRVGQTATSYFVHDQRNQIKEISFQGVAGTTHQFLYNGVGERVSMVGGQGAAIQTFLTYDGQQMLAERDGTGFTYGALRWGPRQQLLEITDADSSSTAAAAQDHRQSVQRIAGVNGGLLASAFGQDWVTSLQSGTRARFVTGAFLRLNVPIQISLTDRASFLGGPALLTTWASQATQLALMGWGPGRLWLDVNGPSPTPPPMPAQDDPHDSWRKHLFPPSRSGPYAGYPDWLRKIMSKMPPPREPEPTPPVCLAEVPTCGPDVTASLERLLRAVEQDYNSWSWRRRLRACEGLVRIAPLFRDLSDERHYIVPHFINAWDIYQFGPGPDAAGAYRSMPVPVWCAVPDYPCGDTVSVHGTCWHRQEVNYILAGMISKLCRGSHQMMETAHFAWASVKMVKAGFSFWSPMPTDLEQRYAIERDWIVIGSHGPSISSLSVQMLDTNHATRPQARCPTTCSKTDARLLYRWSGHVGG